MDEQLGQPLDGLELDYTDQGGGQIIASFSHGRLKLSTAAASSRRGRRERSELPISARSR